MFSKVLCTLLLAFSFAACKNAPALTSERSPVEVGKQVSRISRINERVHVALNYGLGNAIFIEGENGVIVVDTLGSTTVAKQALGDYRKHVQKPIRAIIYTHNHADHTYGASVFAEGREIPIYAHENTSHELDHILSLVRPAIYTRSMRMFGNALKSEEHKGCGIGPFLEFDAKAIGLLRPTHTFKDQQKLNIEGVELELVYAPGETDDQLFVWLPKDKMLLAGDNFYKSFPNLYTLRGTKSRDVKKWISAIDTMREKGAEILVPSHTLPLKGKAHIENTLRHYRDAIAYVHDQTVRHLNKGLTPDEIVEKVTLPAHLKNDPYLKESYGTVAWSVRSIFDSYLGWFSGDATDIDPLSEKERGLRLSKLMQDKINFRDGALQILDDESSRARDHQWAAELARWASHASTNQKERALNHQLWARALVRLGNAHVSQNARNTYLTQARELRGELVLRSPSSKEASPSFLKDMPVERFIEAMPVHLKAEDALETNIRAAISMRDTGAQYTVEIREGVAIVHGMTLEDIDFRIDTDSSTWKKLEAIQLSPTVSISSGHLSQSGSLSKSARFLSLFEKP